MTAARCVRDETDSRRVVEVRALPVPSFVQALLESKTMTLFMGVECSAGAYLPRPWLLSASGRWPQRCSTQQLL